MEPRRRVRGRYAVTPFEAKNSSSSTIRVFGGGGCFRLEVIDYGGQRGPARGWSAGETIGVRARSIATKTA